MAVNRNAYDYEEHIAQLYDSLESTTADIDLILLLITGRGRLRILEPFSGSGRILFRLAAEGHTLVGIDQSKGMLAQARRKLAELPAEMVDNVQLIEADAVTTSWPTGFDLVILGGNCFYELATPKEQEQAENRISAGLSQRNIRRWDHHRKHYRDGLV